MVPTAFYLVERYWPDVTEAGLSEAVESVSRASAESTLTGRPVRHVHSVLAVPEEVVFSLFEACGADAVDDVHVRSGVPFDRIVEALVVPGEGGPR